MKRSCVIIFNIEPDIHKPKIYESKIFKPGLDTLTRYSYDQTIQTRIERERKLIRITFVWSLASLLRGNIFGLTSNFYMLIRFTIECLPLKNDFERS